MMPADSNLLNSELGNFKFFRIKAAGLCENWGMAAGVDVLLNPMLWCWLHIPGSKMEGNF
jgi:hypothetical protein